MFLTTFYPGAGEPSSKLLTAPSATGSEFTDGKEKKNTFFFHLLGTTVKLVPVPK